MANTNSPAVLMAGPPHCGKSVLSTELSMHLRSLGIPHILFRAAPDGEGDWSYDIATEQRKELRHKGRFTAEHYVATLRAIRNRHLPMLVDVGGKPQGRQFDFISACTHVIHLFRDGQDKQDWEQWLEPHHLNTIARLQSILAGTDHVVQGPDMISGVISGLDRDRGQTGAAFDAVAAQVSALFRTSAAEKAEHLRQAPAGATVIVVEEMAERLEVEIVPELGYWWKPEDLPRLLEILPADRAIALYGRGPVWLFAAVGAHIAPQPLHIFDARYYGWMQTPALQIGGASLDEQLEIALCPGPDYLRLRFYPKREVLTPTTVRLPRLPRGKGLVFDGKLPIWIWGALANALADWPWLGVYEPRGSRIVVIAGGDVFETGETIPVEGG